MWDETGNLRQGRSQNIQREGGALWELIIRCCRGAWALSFWTISVPMTRLKWLEYVSMEVPTTFPRLFHVVYGILSSLRNLSINEKGARSLGSCPLSLSLKSIMTSRSEFFNLKFVRIVNRGEAVAVTTQLVNFILARNVILDRAVKTARYICLG